MKFYNNILSVLLAAYMLLAPLGWGAQATNISNSPIQELKIHSFNSPALTAAAFSFKSFSFQNFGWEVFWQKSLNFQHKKAICFLFNKVLILVTPYVKNTIYINISINAP